MMPYLVFFNALALSSISLLHFYWVFGGTWAADAVVPTQPTGQKVFSPGKAATVIVAFSLILFVIITVANLGLFNNLINKGYIHYATNTIGIIFTIRAIGDFKFVGLTKRIKNTRFGKNDTKIYTPLCLVLAVFSLAIAALS